MRKLLALSGIILGISLTTMNWSILNNALSTIQKNLSATVLQLQWIVNIYGIFLASCILMVSNLADSYGHRRLYLLSLSGIAIGSLGAGLASSSAWVIAAQALIGFCGSAILPIAQVLILREFSEEEHPKAMGIWAGAIGFMLGIGPLVGGLILDFWNWRWIFLINVPIAAACILLILAFVRKSPKPKHPLPMDWKSSFLIIATVAALVLGMMQGADWGWSSLPLLTLFVFFLLSLFLLIWVLKKSPHPMIPPSLFLNKTFLLASSAVFCLNLLIWSIFFLFPLYFQNVRNISPLKTGAFMLLLTGPVAFFGPKIGKLYNKIGCRPLLWIGFSFLIASTCIQAVFEAASSLWFVAAGCLLFGIGWMLIYGSSAAAALLALPQKLVGVGAGTYTTILEIGGAVGLAICGTVFRISDANAFIRSLQTKGIVLLGEHKGSLGDFISDPAAISSHLGTQLSSLSKPEFFAIFNSAFMTGYHNAMWVLCAVSILGLFTMSFLKIKLKNSFTK